VEVNKCNTIQKYYSDFTAIMTKIPFIFMPVTYNYTMNQNTIFIPSTNFHCKQELFINKVFLFTLGSTT